MNGSYILCAQVQFGTEAFAFNLFVLGSIEGSNGAVWRKRNNHLYAVEMLDFGPGGEVSVGLQYQLIVGWRLM